MPSRLRDRRIYPVGVCVAVDLCKAQRLHAGVQLKAVRWGNTVSVDSTDGKHAFLRTAVDMES